MYEEEPSYSSSPSFSRARQPAATKVSPTPHPRSPKEASSVRSLSSPTSSHHFSSTLTSPGPVNQPALPERQSAIPKPVNYLPRKEMATTKSLHSSGEYARHSSRASSPKSRQPSPTRKELQFNREDSSPAMGYDRQRAVETLRKKAQEVENLIHQMHH
jgi:hypothetical protein